MEIKRPTGNQNETVSETQNVSEIVSEKESKGQWKSNKKEIKRPTGNQNQKRFPKRKMFPKSFRKNNQSANENRTPLKKQLQGDKNKRALPSVSSKVFYKTPI